MVVDSPLASVVSLVAIDEVADLYKATVCTQRYSESVRIGSTRQALWKKIIATLEPLDAGNVVAERAANVVVDCFKRKDLKDESDILAIIETYLAARNQIHGRQDTYASLLTQRKVA